MEGYNQTMSLYPVNTWLYPSTPTFPFLFIRDDFFELLWGPTVIIVALNIGPTRRISCPNFANKVHCNYSTWSPGNPQFSR